MKTQESVTAEGTYRTATIRCGERAKGVCSLMGVEAGEQNNKTSTLLPRHRQEQML